MEWKTRKGLYTEVVTLGEIYAEYSGFWIENGLPVDNTLRIKHFIRDCAESCGTKWVLLGGDLNIVPARSYFAQGVDGNRTPSDIFYACFEGTFNWKINDGLDGAWHQDPHVDYTPGVYLSRIPVRNTEDVLNYTQKLLAYERDVPHPETVGRMLAAGLYSVGGIQSPQTYNDTLCARGVLPYWDGPVYHLYDSGSSLPDGDGWAAAGTLEDEMARGYGLIHVCADGDEYGWYSDGLMDPYGFDEADGQESQTPAVVVSNAGWTNMMDAGECLASHLVRNPAGGAVAFFGNTRNRIQTGTFDCNLDYSAGFFRNLFTGCPADAPYCFGAVAAQAKLDLAQSRETPTLSDGLQNSVNPLGDPEMWIFTETPKSFVTSQGWTVYGPQVAVSFSGILLVASTVDSCRIVVVDSEGGIHVAENTGSASFSGLSGTCKVSILKHNYIPFLTDVSISGGSGFGAPMVSLDERDGQTWDAVFLTGEREECGDNEDGVSMRRCENWRINVADALTGECRVSENVRQAVCTIQTAGWKPGIYAVHATDGEHTACAKFTVK